VHANTLCQKLNKVIAPVFGYGGVYQFLGHGVKPPGVILSLPGTKAYRIFGEIIPWRVMVSAAVYAVAFTNVVGKGFAGFGVDVEFKASFAVVAMRTGKAAVPAGVGL